MRVMHLRSYLENIQVEEVIEQFFLNAQEELLGLNLPLSWNELIELSDDAAKDRTRPQLDKEDEEQIEEGVLPEVALGKEIVELSFAIRFDELQILYHECQRNNREWTVDWSERSPDGNTPFNMAARLNGDGFYRVACMQLLLDLGASPSINELDSDGLSALHRFVLLNDTQCVKFLLQQEGLDLEAESGEGRTALFLCAEVRHIHIARDLLRRGAYLHTTSDTGLTVLMSLSLCCQRDNITSGELVRNLAFWIDAGVDLEVPDGQAAWRAIHYAAGGRFDSGAVALQALLRRGAHLDAKTRFHQTPLQVAVCHANLDAIRMLVAAEGSRPSIPFNSEAPLLLNENYEARRDEITTVLKRAQAWEQRKILLFLSLRGFWAENGGYVGVALGMGLIAVLLQPMQAYFARLRS